MQAGERRGLSSRIGAIGGGAPLLPLVLLFGLNAVDELDRTAFGLLLPEIRRAFGLGFTGVTVLTAAVIPASLIVAVPVARLADRRHRIPIALIGASCWGVFSMLTGLAPTLLLLGLTRVGAGLGRAVNDPVHGSLLSDYYPPLARAKVFSTHRAANTIGAFVGPLVAGFVADAVGWRVPFIVLSVPTLLLVVIAALLLKEPPRTGRHLTDGVPRFRDAFRTLWRVRTLRQIWFAFPFLAFTTIGLAPLFALYYDELFGVSASGRGAIQAFDAPFIVLGLVIAAPRIDRGMSKDSGRVMRRIGLAATTIAILILGAATAPRLWVGIIFAYSIVALGAVLLAGGIAIVSLVAPPEARASAFAFFNISALLGAVSLPIVGAVSDAVGIRWGMAVLTPMMVIGGFFVASAGRHVNEDIARVNPDRANPPTLLGTDT